MAKVEDIEIQFLPKGVKGLVRDFDNLTEKEKELLKSLGDVNKKLNETEKSSKRFGNTLKQALGGIAVAQIAREVAGLVVSINEFDRKLAQNASLAGKELNDLSAKSRGLAKTFSKDQNELSLRVNAFAKQYNSTQQEALELIKIGFREGADNAGKFLDLLEEYPIQFRNAGLSQRQFIQYSIQSARGGTFADKLLDTVKEVGLRLRELSPAAQDAIKQLGQPFAARLIKGIRSGNLSTDKAFLQILKRSKELNLSIDKTQKIITDLGGGALEDLGGLNEAIRNINEAQKINLDVTSKASKQIEKRIELDRELAEAQGALAKELQGVAKDSQELYQEVQILVFQGLVEFVQVVKAAPRFIRENRDILIALGISLVALNAQFLASRIQVIAYSTAQKTATVATNLFTRATNGLKAALRTNPLGVALAAATALYAAYRLLTSQSSRFAQIQKRVEKTGNEAASGLRKQNTEFNLQINRLKKLNPSSEERKKLIEEINKKYKDYLPSLLTEKSSLEDIERAQKKVNDTYRIRISLISKEKQLDLIGSEIAKLEKANSELNKLFLERKQGNAIAQIRRLFSEGESGLQKEVEKNEALIEKLKTQGEELLKVISDVKQKNASTTITTQEDKPSKNRTGGVDTNVLKAARKLAEEKLKLEKASATELEKIRLERRIRETEDAQKGEKDFAVKKRLVADEKKFRVELAELEKKEALEVAKTESQKLVAQEKFATKKVEIENGVKEKLKQIQVEILQNGKKAAAERRALERNSKRAADLELDRLELKALEDLRKRYKEGKVDFEKFQKEKTEIAFKFGKKRLEGDIAFLENQLSTQGLSTSKRISIEQKLFDKKKELGDLELADYFRREKAKTDSTTKEGRKRQEILEASFEFSKTLSQSVFDFQKAARDEELQDLQIQKELELAAAGENAAARERIEEKFHKKEQQLAIKQAKADKAASLFQIAIQTAENIVRVAAKPALIPFVVATGLLQAGVVAKQPLPKFHQGKEAQGSGEIFSIIQRQEKVLDGTTSKNLLKSGWTNEMLSELGRMNITPAEMFYPRYELAQIPLPGSNSQELTEIKNRQDFIEQKIEDLTQGFHVTIGTRGGDFAAYLGEQAEEQNTMQERRDY